MGGHLSAAGESKNQIYSPIKLSLLTTFSHLPNSFYYYHFIIIIIIIQLTKYQILTYFFSQNDKKRQFSSLRRSFKGAFFPPLGWEALSQEN